MSTSLLDDLEAAITTTTLRDEGCVLCDAIGTLEEGPTRSALTAAAAGKLGVERLVLIMKRNGITAPLTGATIGRRTIERHRKEEHTP
jgi:hypothetical protein